MVNIKGLDKARVLKALWDNSNVHDSSYFSKMSLDDIGFTINHAKAEVNYLRKDNHPLNFFYVYGHSIFCDISNDEFDPWRYDMACGIGAANEAINRLRKEVAVMDNTYTGPKICIELSDFNNNDKLANMIHEAFHGKKDYIDNNVIINKDPDETTGKERVGVYICVDDLTDSKDVFDTLKAVIKSVQDFS